MPDVVSGHLRTCSTRPLRTFAPGQQGGNFHLKVGGAKSSGNAGDPMLGVAVIP